MEKLLQAAEQAEQDLQALAQGCSINVSSVAPRSFVHPFIHPFIHSLTRVLPHKLSLGSRSSSEDLFCRKTLASRSSSLPPLGPQNLDSTHPGLVLSAGGEDAVDASRLQSIASALLSLNAESKPAGLGGMQVQTACCPVRCYMECRSQSAEQSSLSLMIAGPGPSPCALGDQHRH